MSRIWAVKQIRIVYTGGMNTEADQVDQLSRLMMEIDHILAMISECVTVNENNAKRHSCLHALFQEKVKSAVALRAVLFKDSEVPIQHQHDHC